MLNDTDPKARITTYQAARKTNAAETMNEDGTNVTLLDAESTKQE